MDLRSARILVAGGTGFIGANLVARLAAEGCRVRASRHERSAIPGLPPVDYVSADFTRVDDCRRAVDGMDVVFMCAANTSGAAAIAASPLAHVTPNVVMNAQLMEAAYHAGVKKLVFISSSVAYQPSDRPVREDEMFDGDPEAVYFGAGWMKRFGEVLCRLYGQKLDDRMSTIAVRPSNCYGPYDKFDFARSHVTAALIRRVVERQTPLVVWGTGNDVRDLIYIDDFINGLLRATTREEGFFAVNLASGVGVSVRQILDIILRIDGWNDPEIRFDSTKPTTGARRLVDITRARELLGFTAVTSLEDGLKRTIAWYREHRASWTR